MRLLAEQAFSSRPSENGSENEEETINALVAQRWSALAAARSGKGGLAKRATGNNSSSLAAAALSLSLSPRALVAAQRRASDLSAEVTLQRARSAMELMGRVRIKGGGGGGGGGGGSGSGSEGGGEEEREGKEAREEELDDEQALSLLLSSSPSPSAYENLSPLPADAAVAAALAGDPAPRILALLLEEPDPEARAALLPDAFDSGEGGEEGKEGEEQEVDFVFTTPMKLVQAIDLELGRLERATAAAGGNGEGNGIEEVEGKFAPPPLFLPGRGPAAAPEGGEELVAVLEDLRQRALEFV